MVRFFLSISDTEILQRTEAANVGIMPAAPHYLRAVGKGEFILGYGKLDEAAIVQGIDRLASVLK